MSGVKAASVSRLGQTLSGTCNCTDGQTDFAGLFLFSNIDSVAHRVGQVKLSDHSSLAANITPIAAVHVAGLKLTTYIARTTHSTAGD